ncbi:TorA maturation chaperone TorD [Roseinatronobacter thiooxidans]|uniref:TorA maturation chaperone TorD n=1 Tax=Roseinatronobacter thiooxidans TaxID=121821 RepID=A0A2W7QC53_9RHOB|nr:molecular chaperone TorD family protein [Roseinatronobacter thiooxidans]PZX46178.1 TorA maturation chaperone TorD [Roseinatronobacter thiooxidans]
MTDSQPTRGSAITAVDAARSEQYRFLARLLMSAPDQALLDAIAQLEGDQTALGQAFAALAAAAANADAAVVEREYFELFVGVGRGELLPYASFYLTGFLNERPLAVLRADLAQIGVARAEGRFEPEDHIALLLEVMADMAAGQIESDVAGQGAFFARHIAPWAGQFFDDLAVAPSARFYRPLAEIGRLLTDIESRAFTLAA